MGNRRLALLAAASLLASNTSLAQPEGEIEMEGDSPAPADPPPEEPAEPQPEEPPPVVKDPKIARKWQQAGDQLIRKGDYMTRHKKESEARTHYENAVTAYQKAIEASDDVSLHYQLAIAEDKAGKTIAALKHMKVVIAAQGVKPDILKKAQAKLDELSMKIGVVTLTITPDGTQVTLGDEVIGDAPLPEPLVLMPGLHKVSLTAVGFQPKDLDLKVEAGSESERTIALDPVPVVAKPRVDVDPEPMPVVEPEKPNLELPLYIGGSATAGFVLIAAATGMVAIGKHGTYTDPAATPAERADARSSGKTLALVTDLCLVGAVGAAAFTAYWYQYKYKPAKALRDAPESSPPTAKVDVLPWVQPQAGGLSLAGSF
jgi:hypothetical protein